jgi:hypothetical protein
MFKKIPDFVLWIVLAAAVALVPIACSSSTSNSDSGSPTDSRDMRMMTPAG